MREEDGDGEKGGPVEESKDKSKSGGGGGGDDDDNASSPEMPAAAYRRDFMARVAAVQEAEVVAAMQDFLTPVFDLRRSTFAVAAQSQMQRSIEDALKSKRNLGFTKKEYEASGKNTRLLLATEVGRAMRYAAIESSLEALEQFNPDSDDAKRASTLLRAVHLVTSSATLNIYGKTNFPGRTAKGQAPHSEIEQLIATLRSVVVDLRRGADGRWDGT